MTFTQGPWRITTDYIGVYNAEGSCIANMDSEGAPDFDVDETLANARLIAAAPRMYAALERLVYDYEHFAKTNDGFVAEVSQLLQEIDG